MLEFWGKMDSSVEFVADETSLPPGGESSQDCCFVTPTKKDGSASTLRRSPRTPKPRFPDWPSPDEICNPDTAPSTPKTTNSIATSTPIEASDPPSPSLEPVSSNDSFIMPTSVRRLMPASPKKTPSKKTPKVDNSGPSPYKSNWPKFLPKNIKLVNKKRLEREDFLQKVDKFDAKLSKLPAELSNSKPIAPVVANDGDIMGILVPLVIHFNPKNVFSSFDEQSLNLNGEMTELLRYPFNSSEGDLRKLCLLLTVTSNKVVFDWLSLFMEDQLRRRRFLLNWNDLKYILINLGLSKHPIEFDRVLFSEYVEQKRPEIWNFKFVFMMIGYSFTDYTKGRLVRMVKFLSDCLFDPILQKCQFQVILLLRQVLKHLLKNGVTVQELCPSLGHIHVSVVANRFIMQCLSVEPDLRPLSRELGYMTIAKILNREIVRTLAGVAVILSHVQPFLGKLPLKDAYQLIAVCENLAAMSSFDAETLNFLEKLADFAENLSLGYSYFENVYFNETVTRLRTLSTTKHL